jgi:rubrerythrin
MKKSFVRKIENFTCSVCGQTVIGNGYTDHCPKCLWSLHVDINPGDRESKCLGLMEPTGVIKEKGEWKISYQCKSCGYTHQCKSVEDDNVEKIIELSTNPL